MSSTLEVKEFLLFPIKILNSGVTNSAYNFLLLFYLLSCRTKTIKLLQVLPACIHIHHMLIVGHKWLYKKLSTVYIFKWMLWELLYYHLSKQKTLNLESNHLVKRVFHYQYSHIIFKTCELYIYDSHYDHRVSQLNWRLLRVMPRVYFEQVVSCVVDIVWIV